MEILDNMPHDRLYKENGKLAYQSVVTTSEDGSQAISEEKAPITDKLCKEFVRLYESMPPGDHVSAKHKAQFTGIIKRLKDIYDDYRFADQIDSNVYAPTAALDLF